MTWRGCSQRNACAHWSQCKTPGVCFAPEVLTPAQVAERARQHETRCLFIDVSVKSAFKRIYRGAWKHMLWLTARNPGSLRPIELAEVRADWRRRHA